MGLITDLFFAIGSLFKWMFETLLLPIGYWAGWFFTIVGISLIIWWLYRLTQFGSENEKDYTGW
ncbi:hypothetical protein [Faecalibacter rhinopitheci]|uniref:Uncharacterized protein n=1 Tax=Faecalibacter rhinopitheci TaxID=2779678 RepID=A0A8J7FQU4_9FLAO|nr:hypothetical protein [Faecalibacter rhinopitheci]MBF0597705.1 hypothetical protein [Faecalibacter rhinopitheci]MBQ0147265.1 hypothetical protein [Candidatus Onthonaster equi]